MSHYFQTPTEPAREHTIDVTIWGRRYSLTTSDGVFSMSRLDKGTAVLLNELDPQERLATIEAQYELLMHRLPERHHRVWAAEAQGGGEVGVDGRPVGEVTLTRLIELSLQKNVKRIVVGEVVGEEVMAMMEAMQGGRGSVSTVHAHSALDTIERLVTLITRARGNVDTSFGYRLVAQNVDLVVHVGLVDESHLEGGRKWRHVDEVVSLEVSRDTHVAHTRIYAPDEYGRACPTGQLPAWISDIERHGFDAGGALGQPLTQLFALEPGEGGGGATWPYCPWAGGVWL